jgi:YVTN family beta-propeller protein
VSVLSTSDNSVTVINGFSKPVGVAITPDGTRAYVTNYDSNTVSVINTATNAVIGSPIAVGSGPWRIAITPDGTRAYVGNLDATVTVINTVTNTVARTISVQALGFAFTPDGARAYLADDNHDTVSVIDTASGTVMDTIAVGNSPYSVAITPDGNRAYVANEQATTVSVINIARPATVSVGSNPIGIAIATLVEAAPAAAPAAPTGFLAITGNRSQVYAVAAVTLVALGVALVLISRRLSRRRTI